MQKIETVVYSLPKVNDKLEESIYAQKLLKEVRFGQFRTRRFSKEKWVRLLGVDTNNFLHMRLMRGLTDLFIEISAASDILPSGLSSEDIFLLKLVATIHDLQEYYHGDKPAPDKTEQDDLDEMATLIQMISELFPNSNIIDQIDRITEVMTDKKSKLYMAWHCIEQMGYMRTALIAYQRLQTPNEIIDHTGKKRRRTLKKRLRALVTNVFQNQMKVILDNPFHYQAVDYFLAKWAPIIDHLFAGSFIDEIQHDYRTEGKGEVSAENQKILEQMSEIKVMWGTYRKEHPTVKKDSEMVK